MSTNRTATLDALDVLVGRWSFGGDVTGEVEFAWLPGGWFLQQVGTLTRGDESHEVVEVIGHEKPFGAAEPSPEVTSRAYTDTGETLDYTHELVGDTLTVWGGPKGSPAYSRATFNADQTVLDGAWHWPGGGYAFTMTRL